MTGVEGASDGGVWTRVFSTGIRSWTVVNPLADLPGWEHSFSSAPAGRTGQETHELNQTRSRCFTDANVKCLTCRQQRHQPSIHHEAQRSPWTLKRHKCQSAQLKSAPRSRIGVLLRLSLSANHWIIQKFFYFNFRKSYFIWQFRGSFHGDQVQSKWTCPTMTQPSW